MSTEHLGQRVYELVDGRMGPRDAAIAMTHMDECETCAAQWRQLSADRDALENSSPSIDLGFMSKLEDRQHMASIARMESESKVRASHRSETPRRVALASSGTLIAATLLLSTAWVMGAPHQVSLEFASEDSGTYGSNVEFMGAQNMRNGEELRTWVHPEWESSGLVPVEATVVRTTDGTQMLLATILADADTIVVTEQHGTLADELTGSLARADVPSRDVYISNFYPPQLIWESGDVVVAIACECALETLEHAAGHFPYSNADDGALERISNGFQEMAEVLGGLND